MSRISDKFFNKARPRMADIWQDFKRVKGPEPGEVSYLYREPFMDGDLVAEIRVRQVAGKADERADVRSVGHGGDHFVVTCRAIDADLGSEYPMVDQESAVGKYVGEAREEYAAILKGVAEKYFTPVPFASDQANRIALRIAGETGEVPEFAFSQKNHADSAVFRHTTGRSGKKVGNGKWFAIVMNVKRSKLQDANAASCSGDAAGTGGAVSGDGRGQDEEIDVMNVKVDPAELEKLLKEPGFCRCYHMNKKLWVTMTLDGRLSDDRVMEMVMKSFLLTESGASARRPKSGEARGPMAYWVIPSRPSRFDVLGGFTDSPDRTLVWHRRIGALAGDIVYIYQTEPIGALRFRCVVQSTMEDPREMVLKLTDVYEPGRYPRAWLNEHGIRKTVRGQRRAPDELVREIEK